jgi:hypothetical protein
MTQDPILNFWLVDQICHEHCTSLGVGSRAAHELFSEIMRPANSPEPHHQATYNWS